MLLLRSEMFRVCGRERERYRNVDRGSTSINHRQGRERERERVMCSNRSSSVQ